MNILSFQFALFFLLVLPCNWLLRGRTGHRWYLLAASYYFYGCFGLEFLGILVEFSFFTWLFAEILGRSRNKTGRFLCISLLLLIGLSGLAFFKYYDFFFMTTDQVFVGMGLSNPLPMLDIFLPVGISFFTFQGLSYAIDVYRDPAAKVGNPLDVFLFVAFFPTILSGPILRARQFVPQLTNTTPLSRDAVSAGYFLLLSGLFKKLVLSSYLASHIVNHVFDFPDGFTWFGALSGVLGYSIQIYCDFSGYTDLVLGVGLLMGFILPENFDRPYSALSLRDFWHRWHISFSTWLRDYLYFSLGGSRVATWRKHLNLVITFALGGLWHGAGLNFIFWGLLHGVGLMFTHGLRDRRKAQGKALDSALSPVTSALSWLLTFGYVTFAWIFFRAESFDRGWEVVARVCSLDNSGDGANPIVLVIIALVLLKEFLDFDIRKAYVSVFNHCHWLVHALVVGLLGTLILRLGPDGVPAFIYFQF